MVTVRRVVAISASAGAVLGALLGAVGGTRLLLRRQAAVARRRIGKPYDVAPDADRVYKRKRGEQLELVVVGDSIAAGLGAELPGETLGARLAKGLAKRTGRAVRLTTTAVVGAESSMLAAQLAGLDPAVRPDVAVVVVGGNDVTHRVPFAIAVRHLADAVADLQRRGAIVVVGTCPDLGALRPVPQPLRSILGRSSRQLAAAQRAAVLARGAHAVELAAVVGPFFVSNPDEMFALDRFHPSPLGYRRMAKAMLPSLLVALGVERHAPFGHHVPFAQRAPRGTRSVDGAR